MKPHTDLSIIIVNYHSDALLCDCLDSIKKYLTGLAHEIIVVSNTLIGKEYKEQIDSISPAIRVIETGFNAGFPAANNIGRTHASSDLILLLNPDTLLTDDSILKMFQYIENRRNIAIIGPRLFNQNRKRQKSFFTPLSLISIIADELYLSRIFPFSFHYYFNRELSAPKKVGYLSGACMLIRSSCLDTDEDMLDERLFWVEDNDVCLRMRKKGYDIVYYPESSVIHYGDQGNQKASRIKIFNQYLGKIKFYQKYHKVLSLMFLKMFFICIFRIKRTIFSVMKKKRDRIGIYKDLENAVKITDYNAPFSGNKES